MGQLSVYNEITENNWTQIPLLRLKILTSFLSHLEDGIFYVFDCEELFLG
jgi:hypothetical protein